MDSSNAEVTGLAGTGAMPASRPFGLAAAISRGFARVDWDQLTIALSLVGLCVLVRVLWLQPVEVWGDAGLKWLFARQLAYANDFSHADWSHHMARLGINIPVFLLQRVLGTEPRFYYVVPVASYALQVLLLYVVGRRLGGYRAGLLSALFAIFYTGMIRSSSQLLPDGIAGTTMLLACYLLLRFYEAEGRSRLRWLFAVALAFIWSYAIKESNLFLAPGMLLCVWVSRRSIKEGAIFTGLVTAYGVLESLGFWIFTKYPTRLSIVEEAPEYDPIRFLQLFDRFAKLEASWQMLIWLWVPSALWLATKRDKAFRPVLIIPATFLFMLTFLVRHLDPVVPWIGNKSRYLAVMAPFFVLGVGLFVAELGAQAWALHRTAWLERLAAKLRRNQGVATLALCSVLGALTWFSQDKDQRFSVLRDFRHQVKVLNDTYRRNLPIVDYSSFGRGVRTAYQVHLRDRNLSQADVAIKGWLPDVDDALRKAKVDGRALNYLLLNSAVYGPNDMPTLLEKGCVLRVMAHGSFIGLVPDQVLPPSCKAP